MAGSTFGVDKRGIPVIDEPAGSSLRKRQSIWGAALAEFLREGYSAASVDVIARQAGVSKPTIYKHFGNKERLFLAVIGGVLSEAYTDLDPQSRRIVEAADLGAALTAFLGDWAGRVLADDILALRRLVIGEVTRFPQLGQLWFDLTHEMMDTPLIEAVAELGARGVLRVPDPQLAVRQLIAMTLGSLQLIHTFVPGREIDGAEPDRMIAEGVAVFLSHYQRR